MENCTYPYKRIIHDMECGILSGRLAPKDSILSVRALAIQYWVNPNTVQRALREFEQKRLIVSRRGSKTVITEVIERIRRFRQDLTREKLVLFSEKWRSWDIRGNRFGICVVGEKAVKFMGWQCTELRIL